MKRRNDKNKKYRVSSKFNALKEVKNQVKSEIQLAMKNNENIIKVEELLKELAKKHDCKANDLKKYLNDANDLEELRIRKNNIISIINSLEKKPILPKSFSKAPYESNDNLHKNRKEWKTVLYEIENFLGNNPKSLQEIKEWILKKEYQPLEGIDLRGIEIDRLRLQTNYGVISGLVNLTTSGSLEDFNLAKKYKDYVKLSVAADGNCFLHTFSMFLTGESNVDITIRLRVALCLEIMDNAEIYFKSQLNENDEEIINDLKNTIRQEEITQNRKWLSSEIIKYLASVLKRPLVSINRYSFNDTHGKKWTQMQFYVFPNDIEKYRSASRFDSIPDKYSEEWVVYNSGMHFQPLISLN
ncbi:hypothetical protein [endosymbiont GvMRE of Glomus versiforme]|uniref:hypothetical protein n=1 Tax=endosymbiont GvMRE of Glomus versiforme TaxID=2039283 RepID=UPI0011C3C8B1|nr:hypothetical protein [endosymbiont GvMRE of Glomus versiforme]